MKDKFKANDLIAPPQDPITLTPNVGGQGECTEATHKKGKDGKNMIVFQSIMSYN